MQTYRQGLQHLYRRITGQWTDPDVTPITDDDIQNILDHSDTAQATRLPAGPVPASRVSLHGDEPGEALNTITDNYDIQDPELVTWLNGDQCSYEIQVDYYSDDLYMGQWQFQDLDADAVWTALNDV
jgi:hypothetical protein